MRKTTIRINRRLEILLSGFTTDVVGIRWAIPQIIRNTEAV
jgi:hypothetical protein